MVNKYNQPDRGKIRINVRDKEKMPIMEVFGPTIQGEGMVIGQKTIFIRTGGCDFIVIGAIQLLHGTVHKNLNT